MIHQFANSEHEAILRQLAKRRNIYTILFVVCLVIGGVCGVIPAIGWYLSIAMLVLWGIFAGFGMLCINYYRYEKSGGRKQGGGLWWFLLFLFGMIIVPVVTVFICNHIRPLAQLILGVQFE